MSLPATQRRVVVCADDFGVSPRADEAMLRLAWEGAISAISAFALRRPADAGFTALRQLPPAVSVGLHFNLTEPGLDAPAQPLASWLARSIVPLALDRKRLHAELQRQCGSFEERVGRSPDFIDGHQHVHQFRGVRESVLSVVRERYGGKVAVRTTRPCRWRGAKAAAIAALGGRALARELQAQGVTTNRDFAGVYDFSTRVSYANRMAGWLDDIADLGLVMCHPQLADARVPSPAREAEFAFLSSATWRHMRRARGIALIPFGGACAS